ncbi:hypothetical protein IC608_13015 [Devosia sp. PTR5]|uniref:LPS export ABC transporter periplasmic protein LptC n=1 Tax=Devosia oryzisoli TaxID=2774138 RepID=A0A927IR71_9HYPH|nr:hypothetical protein [Devosia oryzisoli]MBD8066390.1 hypothetical protein [Devosia oryzisoli]
MRMPAADRASVYRRLQRRNRTVSVLRLAVPALGFVVLLALSAQIYLSSLGSRFGIDHLTVTPVSIDVDAPEYTGLLEDGSSYRVSAAVARAATSQTEIIDLSEASLSVTNVDGVEMTADAPRARLDTVNQTVQVPGTAQIGDSTGTEGTLTDSVFDWSSQVLTTEGPVAIDYADGAAVRAEGLVYDAKTAIWTFNRATVTLPDTPKAEGPVGDPATPGASD